MAWNVGTSVHVFRKFAFSKYCWFIFYDGRIGSWLSYQVSFISAVGGCQLVMVVSAVNGYFCSFHCWHIVESQCDGCSSLDVSIFLILACILIFKTINTVLGIYPILHTYSGILATTLKNMDLIRMRHLEVYPCSLCIVPNTWAYLFVWINALVLKFSR